MADDRIDVVIGAQTAELKSGLNQATASVTQATDTIKEKFSGLTESVSGIGEAVRGIEELFTGLAALAVAAFAFDKVKEGLASIKELASGAAEFNEGIEAMTLQLGTTAGAANVLHNALATVGVSTDEYTNMQFKLERQLKANEDRFVQLGVATRDQNGQLVSGQQLMQNAVAVLNQYSAGTERNLVSMELFGRGAQEVYKIQKLTAEVYDQTAQRLAIYGATTQDEIERSEQFEQASNSLGIVFDTLQVKLGNALTPALTALATEMRDVLGPTIDPIVTGFKVIVSVFDAVFVAAYQLVRSLSGIYDTLKSVYDGVGLLGKASAQALHGDFDGAQQTVEQAAAGVRNAWTSTFADIETSGKNLGNRLRANFGTPGPSEVSAGGNKKYTPDNRDKAAKELAEQQKLRAQEDALDRQFDALDDAREKAQDRAEIDAAQGKAQTLLSIKQNNLQTQLQLGNITGQQEVQGEIEIENAKYQAALQGLQKTRALGTTTINDKIDIDKQIEKLEQQHQLALAKLANQAALQRHQQEVKDAQTTINAWKGLVSPISNAFDQITSGILQGTLSWRDAVRNFATDMVVTLANAGAKMLENLLLNLIIGEAAQKASAGESIMTSAKSAAAGAYSSVSSIPYVGWILGPIAAAAAFAGVMAFGSFAVGTPEVPRDMIAQIHQGEMIVPATMADGVRSGTVSLGGGDGGDKGISISTGDLHFHGSNPKANARDFLKEVAKGYRNNPSLRPA